MTLKNPLSAEVMFFNRHGCYMPGPSGVDVPMKVVLQDQGVAREGGGWQCGPWGRC